MTRRLVTAVIGVSLLAAAALKLYGLNVSPFAQYGRLITTSVQFAAVEWEIVLGLWLLSGRRLFGAWVAAVLSFSTFAVVSGYLGSIGQASCGCFGAVKASPWIAFTVDSVALVLLGIARPNFRDSFQSARGRWGRIAVREFGTVALAIAFCAGIIGVTSLAFGSPDAALARLRGESIVVRPGIADVGTGEAGQIMETTVEVVNWTNRAVQIFGGTSDCSCVVTKNLPLTLAPGEARVLSVEVRLPASPGLFNRKAYYWTDCDSARTVLFGLTGRITPASGEATVTSVE